MTREQVLEALRGMSEIDRATIYAESVQRDPAPIGLDDLKTMTPQQIIDALAAGQLDHLPAEQSGRNQARRDERATRSANKVQREQLQRQLKCERAAGLRND